MKSKLILFTLCSIILFSCKKDKDAPVLTISSPSTGATINGVVNITGIVTDKELHQMEITITKNSDASVLYTKIISVHELTTYNFNETYTPTGITADTDVTLTIKVEDHVPNITTKIVVFKLVP